jgi:hypothetical protein
VNRKFPFFQGFLDEFITDAHFNCKQVLRTEDRCTARLSVRSLERRLTIPLIFSSNSALDTIDIFGSIAHPARQCEQITTMISLFQLNPSVRQTSLTVDSFECLVHPVAAFSDEEMAEARRARSLAPTPAKSNARPMVMSSRLM